MPFRRKLTPAAFPALTNTSWLARTEVCAGAIKVSSATGLPSATMETQVFSSARMSRVKVGGGFTAAAGVEVFASGGLAVAEDTGCEDADTPGWAGVGLFVSRGVGLGEVVSPEMVSDFIVPEDSVPAGDGFPPVCELVEAVRGVGAAAGTGTGAGASNCCGEAAGSDAVLGPV